MMERGRISARGASPYFKSRVTTKQPDMSNYSIDYVVPIWIEIQVKAETEEDAKVIAKEEIAKISWKLTRKMSVVDYATKYAGIRLIDVLDEVNA